MVLGMAMEIFIIPCVILAVGGVGMAGVITLARAFDYTGGE